MFPTARLNVQLVPFESDDVVQEPFGEPMLAHYRHRMVAAFIRQLQVPVISNMHQAVALHAGNRLADGRARLAEALGDSGS
jgi:hypothetical protein